MPDSLRMPPFISTPPYDNSPLLSSSSSLRSITTDERSLMNIGPGGPFGAALETVEKHQVAQPLVFVSDWASPFAQRTWMALEHRRIPYQYQEATQAEKVTDEAAWTPNEFLPAIRIDGREIRGSVNLIEFLEDAFPGHEPKLLSGDPTERVRERMWTDFVRRAVVPPFVRLSRSNAETLQDFARVELCRALDVFSQEVRGPFFSGDLPTLPDLTLAPFVARARAAVTRSPDSVAGLRYQAYAEKLLALESLKATMPQVGPPLNSKCADTPSPSRPVVPRLPPELITHIINFLGDYELASTLGVPHDIPETTVWSEQATQLDRAILTGSLRVVQERYAAGHRTFSQWGSRVMLRFGYTEMLEWLRSSEPVQLHRTCDDLLPIIASAWGRVNVLRWALDSGFGVRPHVSPSATNQESPMDVASTDGHVETLEFWRRSGLPLVYSELALNGATRYSEFACLEWWKTSGLALKIGNVLDYASMEPSGQTLGWWARSGLEGKYSKKALYYASCAGSLAVLDWWKASGLALLYDEDVVVGATKHGRVDCLDWWERSALEVKYTAFEIEEAIEDCLAGADAREAVKRWWTQRGLLKDEGDWTKPRLLSSRR